MLSASSDLSSEAVVSSSDLSASALSSDLSVVSPSVVSTSVLSSDLSASALSSEVSSVSPKSPPPVIDKSPVVPLAFSSDEGSFAEPPEVVVSFPLSSTSGASPLGLGCSSLVASVLSSDLSSDFSTVFEITPDALLTTNASRTSSFVNFIFSKPKLFSLSLIVVLPSWSTSKVTFCSKSSSP